MLFFSFFSFFFLFLGENLSLTFFRFPPTSSKKQSDYDFGPEDAADGNDGNSNTSRAASPCGGWLVANPTVRQAASSTLDLVLAGTSAAVMMIEGYCSFLEDEVMVAAVELGAAAVAATASAVDEWAAGVRAAAGTEKRTDRVLPDPSLFERVCEFASAPLSEVFGSSSKAAAGRSKEELSASVAEIRRGAAAAVGLGSDGASAAVAAAAGISGGDGSGDRASSAASAAASTASSDDDEGASGIPSPPPSVKPSEAAFNAAFKRATSAAMRSAALGSGGVRSDGRAVGEVRPIAARAGLLPRTHGSALFTRGETQAVSFSFFSFGGRERERESTGGGRKKKLTFFSFFFPTKKKKKKKKKHPQLAVTTLGAASSAQRVDSMTIAAASNDSGGDSSSSNAESNSTFYLQYFFPPCSVGETGRVGSPGRREVGHGALAERALAPVVPSQEEFPYTVRVESTITESNGSSSMASVCGGCLSMLDAGVPLKAVVAGVAMGLILEKDDSSKTARFQILTDILGSEDALGDMDFKVAGDADRVTAFQMDVKVDGITPAIISAALSAARDARRVVLSEMAKCSPPPRRALAPHAPRIELVRVPSDRLGQIIGPGGKTIRGIREASRCDSVNVLPDSENSADGTSLVELCDASPEAVAAAKAMVLAIAIDPPPGSQFPRSRVNSVERFGLIVEFVPGKSGLAHVSELPFNKSDPESYSVGDKVDVVLLEGENGRYKLSLRAFPGSGGSDGEGEEGGERMRVRGVGGGGGSSSSSSRWAESSSSSSTSSSSSYSSAPPRSNRREEFSSPPPRAPLQPVEEGAVFRGATVRGVQPFGVFADLGGGRSGMVHVSELREPRPADPGERYARGDKVDVVVLSAENGRISLSEKRVVEAAAGKSAAGGDDFDDDDGDGDDDGAAPRTPQQLAEETGRRLGLMEDDEDDYDESDFA